jgi:hypothetical protein
VTYELYASDWECAEADDPQSCLERALEAPTMSPRSASFLNALSQRVGLSDREPQVALNELGGAVEISIPWFNLDLVAPTIVEVAIGQGVRLFDPQSGQMIDRRAAASTEYWRSIRDAGWSRVEGALAEGLMKLDQHTKAAAGPMHQSGPVLAGALGLSLSDGVILPELVPDERQTDRLLQANVGRLRDGAAFDRRNVALDLGGWSPRGDLIDALRAALSSDPDSYVRACAAQSLALLGDEHSLAPILEETEEVATKDASGETVDLMSLLLPAISLLAREAAPPLRIRVRKVLKHCRRTPIEPTRTLAAKLLTFVSE